MAELEAREAAAHARAEALRARIAALTEQLAGEEELLSRLGITRQTVLEILGGRDVHGSGAPGGAGRWATVACWKSSRMAGSRCVASRSPRRSAWAASPAASRDCA